MKTSWPTISFSCGVRKRVFPCCKSELINRGLLEMFSGYQERDDYEDELYRDDADSSLSDTDSELEFRLYSQLHYGAEIQKEPEDLKEVQSSVPRTQTQQNSLPPAPPVDVIVIDSGTDSFTVSDNTEEDDGICTSKGQSSKCCNRKLQPHLPLVQAGRTSPDDIVVLDSESDDSSSKSVAPFVADLGSDSDSDGLENWMILGQTKEDGDQSIQLNLSLPENANVEEKQNWTVSERDKQAQICNKGVGLRRVLSRYYAEKTITCHNCRKSGHLSKNCPTPRKLQCCSLCGLQGHFLRTCPNRYCSNCSLPGHTYDDCLERAYWHKCCHRCGMTGHYFDVCPEIWRQYHITTTMETLCQPSGPEACRKPAYCYNCSKKGHFGHECTGRRMYNGTYPTLPFISHYDTKRDFECREFRLKKKAEELQEAGLISPDGAVITYTPQPPRKKQKTSHNQSPYPHNTHTNNQHTPKRRIAHTPKHHPQNTHLNVKHNSQTRGKHGKHTPQSNSKPQEQSKKEAEKKKTKTQSKAIVLDEDEDFPRGCKKSPHTTKVFSSHRKADVKPKKPIGMEKNNKKKTDQRKSKGKKKERSLKKRQRKAAKDSSMYPSDENLFLIKQRKV